MNELLPQAPSAAGSDHAGPRRHRKGPWYRLDNTGNLYPSVLSGKNTTLFRIGAVMDRPVHADRLNRALVPVMRRFPYYRVHLRRGAFWYSFEENRRELSPVLDGRTPCLYMPIKRRGVFPLRVRVFGRSLAVEFSHALTDGTGALLFLKSLLASYLIAERGEGESGRASEGTPEGAPEAVLRRELGVDPEILLLDEEGNCTEARDEEFQDAFRLHYDRRIPPPPQEREVFHLPGRKMPAGRYRVISGDLPVGPVVARAKVLGVSLTEYLTAVYFYALQEIQECRVSAKGGQTALRKGRARWDPLSVMVPVNLRSFLPSATMRNFFLTLNPLLDTRLGHYDFEEIAVKVHHSLRTMLDRRHLAQHIRRNVGGTVHPILRLAPLFLKDIALKSIYRGYGENTYSGSLSNLGRITLPEPLRQRVERFTFVPPPSPVLGTKCGVLSYGETLTISFGSLMEEALLERLFFRFLRREGFPVKLRGNWKGEE